MASDYERITRENIRKRGEDFEDIGRFFAEQLYSGRTHFVYELLQNAEDALGRRIVRGNDFRDRSVAFHLFRDRLELRHSGEPFSEDDVKGICNVLKGTKAGDENQIGRFGIGFKSVYAYTSSPEVHSGDEHFRIERYIRPHAVPPRAPGEETLFVFPFDHEEVSSDEAFEDIRTRLDSLGPRTLLFLRNVDEISWTCEGKRGGTYLREDALEGGARLVTVVGEHQEASETQQEEWLVFERRVGGSEAAGTGEVEVAFRLERDEETGKQSIVSAERPELVVFFPTEKETHLGFLVQGPYRTTPARDNVAFSDGWNEALVEETATLVVDSLREIRDLGLLTAGFLEVLPIHPKHFKPGSPFRPVFERVREALSSQDLLPTESGRFVPARCTRLARTAGLRELISDEQLDQLLGGEHPLRWLPSEITYDRMPDLRQYLVGELGVDEITPETVARRIDASFMRQQTDDWVIRFYAFLDEQKSLWRPRPHAWQEPPLRNKPFVRLQDFSHVSPFHRDGRTPRAFLPVGEEMELPSVRREVAADTQARQFLVNLGLAEPNIVDEVVEKVLPKYRREEELNPNEPEHDRDVRKIMRALGTDSASASKRGRLVDALLATPFLRAHNPATGRVASLNPGSVYFRAPMLELYFEGHPSAWFLDDRYSRYERELSRLGVSSEVRIQSREPDHYGMSAGHIVVVDTHGWHVRGLYGFDPDCEIDGLEHALDNTDAKKAAYVWNVLLAPNSQHVRGRIEHATRQNFENGEVEEKFSTMGTLATKKAWMPHRDGSFRRPSELGLGDLPEGFVSDERLADALGMRSSDVTLLADKLGITSEDIDFMVRNREEFERFKRETEEGRLASQQGPEHAEPKARRNGDGLDFAEGLKMAFTKPGGKRDEEPPLLSGPVGNPGLRRERTRDEIEAAKREEPELEERFVRVPRKVWERKNNSVRVFLLQQYGGECQICTHTFPKRGGEPYFEGLYLVSSTEARWLDRPGNVLCLCATCSAKFQHGQVEAEKDILDQITGFRTQREGGSEDSALRIRLCGKHEKVHFSEQHLIELQTMIEHGKA